MSTHTDGMLSPDRVTDEYLQFIAEGEIGNRRAMARELLAYRRDRPLQRVRDDDNERAAMILEASDDPKIRRMAGMIRALANAGVKQ